MKRENEREWKVVQAWEYVHGELDAQACAEIEKAALSDEDLQKHIAEFSSINAELQQLAPLIDWTEENLEECLLEEWEAEETARLEAMPLNVQQPAHSPFVFSLRPAISGPFGVALSLAAALIVIMTTSIHMNSQPLGWNPTEIVQAQTYRGVNGVDYPPVYTRQQLSRFAETLRAAVRQNYDTHASRSFKSLLRGRKNDWVMSTRFQEFREGKLSVQVKAYDKGGKDLTKQWNRYFTDSNVFLAQVNEYGTEIAAELLTMRNRQNGGT